MEARKIFPIFAIFDWYGFFYDRNPDPFPEAKERLGHVIGPCKNEVNKMAPSVFTLKGTVVPIIFLRPISTTELVSDV